MSNQSGSTASLAYHEPGIVTILILSSLLLLLNAVNHVIDKLLYCGLIGQIFLGVAWGTPGGKWLPQSAEELIVQLGYLGLLLLVYEGGLSTNFAALKANALVSICAAFTGIAMPIAMSYVLMALVDASPLQAFAAGAALCSTSLGTTFTVLKTTGLADTRLGVVLSSAAILDDVVGLVMVQVIQTLGESVASFTATTVIRPVFVAVAFALLMPLIAWVLVKPITIHLNKHREKHSGGIANKLMIMKETSLVIHSVVLISMIVATSYAGTSNLFAAWIAGATISWWDVAVPHALVRQQRSDQRAPHSLETLRNSGQDIFAEYYEPALKRVLKPFFFASIGFSIPISKMFTREIIWKGVVFTLLMAFGKLVCGIWLVRLPSQAISGASKSTRIWPPSLLKLLMRKFGASASGHPISPAPTPDGTNETAATSSDKDDAGISAASGGSPKVKSQKSAVDASRQTRGHSPEEASSQPKPSTQEHPAPQHSQHAQPAGRKPLSLYPAAIFGTAMVARGEIGFLISSVAQSSGIFGSQIFLVVTWAIMLCTLVGPLAVGTLVKRIKRLQAAKIARGETDGALGEWGVG